MAQFYTDNPSPCLRLGDVVSGFVLATPKSSRLAHSDDAPRDLAISIGEPRFLVVMTPCCNIEEGSIVLAPLSKIRHGFFKNPTFEEDLSRINRKLMPKEAMPPPKWEALTPQQKAAELSKEPDYALRDCFIYEPHPLLPPYQLKKGNWERKTGYYMVDFKAVYRFESTLIKREGDGGLIPEGCNKLLQLTAQARKEFRDKFACFFGRPSEEDMLELTL